MTAEFIKNNENKEKEGKHITIELGPVGLAFVIWTAAEAIVYVAKNVL